jgi:predicted dithiol-disulfide oxidoreductase (DUF899 family)
MANTVVTRQTWLIQRMALLRAEKALRLELDQLELPTGVVSLDALFAGASQLLIYHFMYGADWSAPCDGCSLGRCL